MTLTLITITHIFVCLLLIGIVLLQQGKGADMGATFGGGSNTVFGASGADNLLTKVTTALAIAFMLTSVVLASRTKDKISGADTGSMFEETDFDPLVTSPAEEEVSGATNDSMLEDTAAELEENAAGAMTDEQEATQVETAEPQAAASTEVTTDEADQMQASEAVEDTPASEQTPQ